MSWFRKLKAADTKAITQHLSTLVPYLSSLAIELNPDYVRAILRRAELYEQTEKLDEALEDYKAVLEKEPGFPAAREACCVSSFPGDRPYTPQLFHVIP